MPRQKHVVDEADVTEPRRHERSRRSVQDLGILPRPVVDDGQVVERSERLASDVCGHLGPQGFPSPFTGIGEGCRCP